MKFYVNGGGKEYSDLFSSLDWEEVDEVLADVIVFTGGSDVNPQLYGQTTHPYTTFSSVRDQQDIQCYLRNLRKMKIGICRGAQFLHVMNGGTLFQDVNNHVLRKHHLLECKATGQSWEVTSTHHQMMAPDAGVVVGIAKETTYVDKHERYEVVRDTIPYDVEVVFHPKAFCFQPHPEFYGEVSTKECFTHFLYMFMEDFV